VLPRRRINDVVTKPINLRRLRAAVAGLTDSDDAEPVATDSPIAAAVLDPATCRELFDDDAAEAREWLTGYLASAAELISGVERNVTSGNRDELTATARKLASASLAVGAVSVGWLARHLETAAAEVSAPELHEIADAVVQHGVMHSRRSMDTFRRRMR